MKLLLDENLSRRILPFLETDFPGSTQLALIGVEQATDEEVWHYAKSNGFCIVTKDADFYDLSLVKGAPPKVIWLKSGGGDTPAEVAGGASQLPIKLDNFHWQTHCKGLYQLPIAA